MRISFSNRIRSKPGMIFFRLFLILAVIAAAACSAGAQKEKESFPDYSGHEFSPASDRLDVPYVSTPMKVVRTLLDLAAVGPNDFLIDLGSGDGRIVITAAKEFGVRGFGVDLNEDLVRLSKKYAAAEGVAKKVDFFVQDIFKTDIRQASVVTMYLLNYVNIQLRPKLLSDLKPGARVVSHDYTMGDWRPDKTVHLPREPYYIKKTTLYLWIIPAKAAGRWQWVLPASGKDQSFELDLE